MTSHTICFISAKGGSGKTVTSSALATFLSELKLRVLLIDLDAATNGLTLLFLQQLLGIKRGHSQDLDTQLGLFEVGPDQVPDKIVINEYFDVVPASFRMRDTEKADPARIAQGLESLLKSASSYDFIFLDAQAGADTFARLAASTAQTSVIVSEYDPVSSQGVERLKVLFGDVIDPAETWTLFNKVLPEFSSAIGEGLAVARFLPPIPWDADVVRAFTRRDLAIDMENPNPYTLSIAQLASALSADTTASAIAEWRRLVSGTLTTPVENRLKNLDELQAKLESDRRRERRRIISFATVLFAIAASLLTLFSTYITPASQTSWQKIFSSSWTIAIPLVALVPVLMDLVTTAFSTRMSDRVADKMLEEERLKLQASLDATHASLRLNERAGYFATIRRDGRV